jgi:hypothetical protein
MTYLVRIKIGKEFIDGGGQPVGVFNVPLSELKFWVDACIRPQDCEYASLSEGCSMSLENETNDGSNPWDQPIRKWTQLEGCNAVRLHWKELPDD